MDACCRQNDLQSLTQYPKDEILAYKNDCGYTLLDICALFDANLCFMYLISCGVTINRLTIHCISKKSSVKCMEIALNHGLDANDNVHNPLHIACDYGSIDCASLLISRGADVNRKNSKGWFPLNYAITSLNFDLFQLLIENGANIRSKNSEELNAIQCSVKYSSLPCLEFLAKKMDINVKTFNGYTLLHLAAAYSDINVIQFLLKTSIDKNAKDNRGRDFLFYMSPDKRSVIENLV